MLGDDGRLRIPRSLVERTLQQARRNLVLHGQNPRWDLDLSGARVHFSTAGAAVMVADSEKGLYRDSEAQDLYDMARIADTCEHIHMFQRTCVPRDIPDNYALDINTLYCCVMGTSKHVGSSWTVGPHLEKSLQMLHMIAGGEAEWRARPFVSQSNCFVVPPLKFATDALECLRVAVDTLSFAEIEQICSSGEGHYLGSGNTLQVMQSEYFYPDFSDRTSPTVWEEQGKPVLLNQAIEKTRDILATSATKSTLRCGWSFRSFFPVPRWGDDRRRISCSQDRHRTERRLRFPGYSLPDPDQVRFQPDLSMGPASRLKPNPRASSGLAIEEGGEHVTQILWGMRPHTYALG